MLIIRPEQVRALARAREAALARELADELRREHPACTARLNEEGLRALVHGQLAAARQARLPLAERAAFVKRAVLERLDPAATEPSVRITAG